MANLFGIDLKATALTFMTITACGTSPEEIDMDAGVDVPSTTCDNTFVPSRSGLAECSLTVRPSGGRDDRIFWRTTGATSAQVSVGRSFFSQCLSGSTLISSRERPTRVLLFGYTRVGSNTLRGCAQEINLP